MSTPRLAVVLGIVLLAPLVVGLLALRSPTWYPVLDLAMTEFRVRDVFSPRIPLIGLPGRIGRTLADQGSHPGPLSFYLLAPVYRLLGSTAWAMQVGTVVLHGLAVGAALSVARRRGGTVVVAAVALLLALLLRGYGITFLTQPWNPYMPVSWWIVLLLAVWSILDDDVAMLPVAVFAASFVAQTHVPYLALSVGLAGVSFVGVVLAMRRRPAGSPERRRGVRWVALSVALGIVVWLPPLIDQALHSPGNLLSLIRHFSDPPERAIGFGAGIRLTLRHLDPRQVLFPGSAGLDAATAGTVGSISGGIAACGGWVIAAAASLLRRDRRLVTLHAVVGAGVTLAVLSISRIFGTLWWYLMLWAWGVGGFMLVASGATVVAVVRSRFEALPSWKALPLWKALPSWKHSTTAALSTATLVVSIVFCFESADAQPPDARRSAALGAVIPGTVAALDDGVLGATGREGTYVVSWSDAAYIGSQAYGLVNELERRGYRAGMTRGLRVPLTDWRVVDSSKATVEIHFASGIYIDTFRSRPGVVEVASADLRTPAERAEFDRLRADMLVELAGLRREDLAELLDVNLFAVSIDERLPRSTRRRLAEMIELGEPVTIFLAPPGTSL